MQPKKQTTEFAVNNLQKSCREGLVFPLKLRQAFE